MYIIWHITPQVYLVLAIGALFTSSQGVLVVDVPTTDVDSLGCDLANAIGFSFDEGHSVVSKIHLLTLFNLLSLRRQGACALFACIA